MSIDNDENIICEFEEWLIADGKAAKTLESYVGDIRTFHQWLKSKGDIYIENLKRFHITSYRNYLVQNNYEINTINKKVNSLKCFNQFLIENNYISEKVVDLKKDKAKLASEQAQSFLLCKGNCDLEEIVNKYFLYCNLYS